MQSDGFVAWNCGYESSLSRVTWSSWGRGWDWLLSLALKDSGKIHFGSCLGVDGSRNRIQCTSQIKSKVIWVVHGHFPLSPFLLNPAVLSGQLICGHFLSSYQVYPLEQPVSLVASSFFYSLCWFQNDYSWFSVFRVNLWSMQRRCLAMAIICRCPRGSLEGILVHLSQNGSLNLVLRSSSCHWVSYLPVMAFLQFSFSPNEKKLRETWFIRA